MKKRTIDHTHLLVLSLLAGEDMYGYQMIMELARRSDHTFEMKEGTLYPVLPRFGAGRAGGGVSAGGSHGKDTEVLSSDPAGSRLSEKRGEVLADLFQRHQRGAAVQSGPESGP